MYTSEQIPRYPKGEVAHYSERPAPLQRQRQKESKSVEPFSFFPERNTHSSHV